MKNVFKFLSAATVAVCVCVISCDKIDNSEEMVPKGWTVAISASKEVDSSTKALSEDVDKIRATFQTTDNIYVYNKTKGIADPSPLHPDKDGAKANIIGTLSESYDKGDELVLCYNPEYIEGKGLRFSYGNQKGDLSSVADFAKATKIITAEEASAKTLSGSVSFENLQSIFRFTFSDDAVKFKRIIISTKKNKLIHTDMTCHEFKGVTTSSVMVTRETPSSEPVYVALRNENTGEDTYLFRAEDDKGFVYAGEKVAPAGKILDGKLYYSKVNMAPQSKFTVTESGVTVSPNEGSYGYKDYKDLYATGTGIGQYILWDYNKLKELTLDNVHLICYDHTPITSKNSTILSLTIIGDNTIVTDANHPGISFCSYYTLSNPHNMHLWVQGNGNLTITASNSIGHSGILNSYGHESYGIRAKTGYSLTLEDVGDNGDGTYTWIYKVRSNPEGQ